jgi:hypothetical protein
MNIRTAAAVTTAPATSRSVAPLQLETVGFMLVPPTEQLMWTYPAKSKNTPIEIVARPRARRKALRFRNSNQPTDPAFRPVSDADAALQVARTRDAIKSSARRVRSARASALSPGAAAVDATDNACLE